MTQTTADAGRTEIKRGVYRRDARWFFRHYAEWGMETGPYETCFGAMKALLTDLNFPVEDDAAAPDLMKALEEIDAMPCSMVNDADSLRHTIKTTQAISRAALAAAKGAGQ